jgi:hypothetical protein
MAGADQHHILEYGMARCLHADSFRSSFPPSAIAASAGTTGSGYRFRFADSTPRT